MEEMKSLMINKILNKTVPVLLVLSFILMIPFGASAQLKEPEVVTLPTPKTPFGEGYRNSLGFDFMLNNFGFGAAGQYSRFIGPFTEITFKTGITGIRDVSEQNFQDFFTGQRIIPNKYNRALGFPFMVGVKRRLFADKIADNFRLFFSSSLGPALAFVYPYINDEDNNGFRNGYIQNGVPVLEPINDFFSGWKNGHSLWGLSGELKIGADLGETFGTQTTVEFGYFFYYFDEGIQIMEPNRLANFTPGIPILVPGQQYGTRPFFDKQKYFGTPQISLIFGDLW